VVDDVERRSVRERDETGMELLLSQPEIVAWLELSEQEIVRWLKPHENADDGDDASRSA
jgi:hypothetical protein